MGGFDSSAKHFTGEKPLYTGPWSLRCLCAKKTWASQAGENQLRMDHNPEHDMKL